VDRENTHSLCHLFLQVNQVTHWMDLSVVYDTSNEANQAIRAGSRGLLAFEIGPDGAMIMPGDTSGRRCGPNIGKCFRAGLCKAIVSNILKKASIIFFSFNHEK